MTRGARQKAAVLLITPPMVQLNTPYPATACLAGCLREHGFNAAQADLSLALALRLFAAEGLREVEREIIRRRGLRTPAVRHFLAHATACRTAVDAAVALLQGRDDSAAWRMVTRGFLPEGPRFVAAGYQGPDADRRLTRLFGCAGVHDAARHLASLFLDDLADAIREGVDAKFALARYAEHLAVSAPRFAPLRRALEGRPTLVDRLIDELADEALAAHQPLLVGLTVPFPGTLYGALRIARRIRQRQPRTRVVIGGGYVSTELRELDEPRVFDYVDDIVFDDGEEPLLRIATQCRDERLDDAALLRTMIRRRGRVIRCGLDTATCWRKDAGARSPAKQQSAAPALARQTPLCRITAPERPWRAALPDFTGLPLARYISFAESPNIMHRLWSDGRWLKLPLAHGCYWRRCVFCDTALDYIGRYAPPDAAEAVDRIMELQRRTGRSGFHFTDEALSPALSRQMSEQMLHRGAHCTWWGNVRLERAFTPELAQLMARAGCVAVTGGLECAHDRLLALMDKGITVRGAGLVCRAMADAGIRVHLYLMYGFPTQTAEETVSGLEVLRRLFAAGVVQSAYWHRFALTGHSPMAAAADAFGLIMRRERTVPGRVFARNEMVYEEPGAPDHEALGAGLRRATYNYMLGLGLDRPAASWFDRAALSGKARRRRAPKGPRP